VTGDIIAKERALGFADRDGLRVLGVEVDLIPTRASMPTTSWRQVETWAKD
jgi:hypothetical protein